MSVTLTLMCGIPRCGKSSWIKKNKKDAIIVSPDMIRKEIFGHQFHQPANKFVFAISEAMVTMLLKQGKDVIVDATHMTRSLRQSWYPVTKNIPDVKTNVVWVYADVNIAKNLQICKARSSSGPKDEFVPDDVLERMASQFEHPDVFYEPWINKVIEWKNS